MAFNDQRLLQAYAFRVLKQIELAAASIQLIKFQFISAHDIMAMVL